MIPSRMSLVVRSQHSLVAYSVILLFRLVSTPPRAPLASQKYVYSPCVPSSFLRSCCLFIYLFFLLFSSLCSISIWTSFVSSCLFLAGTMLPPGFRFLLRLV